MKTSSIFLLLASTALAWRPETTPCDDDKTTTSIPQPQSTGWGDHSEGWGSSTQGWGSPSVSLSVPPHSQWPSSASESNTVVPVTSPAGPSSTGVISQPWIPTTIVSSPAPTGVTTKTSTYTTTTCPGKFSARLHRENTNISCSWHNHNYFRL